MVIFYLFLALGMAWVKPLNWCTFKLTFIHQTFSILIRNYRSDTNDSSAALIVDDGWERELK